MKARPLSDFEMVMVAIAACLCTLVLTKVAPLTLWFLELAGATYGIIIGVYLAKANDPPKSRIYLSVVSIFGGILVIALLMMEAFGWI